jgi:hypothetical protein
MKMYKESGSKALHILNHGIRWKRMIKCFSHFTHSMKLSSTQHARGRLDFICGVDVVAKCEAPAPAGNKPWPTSSEKVPLLTEQEM